MPHNAYDFLMNPGAPVGIHYQAIDLLCLLIIDVVVNFHVLNYTYMFCLFFSPEKNITIFNARDACGTDV